MNSPKSYLTEDIFVFKIGSHIFAKLIAFFLTVFKVFLKINFLSSCSIHSMPLKDFQENSSLF